VIGCMFVRVLVHRLGSVDVDACYLWDAWMQHMLKVKEGRRGRGREDRHTVCTLGYRWTWVNKS
jgi:hypothetical protein